MRNDMSSFDVHKMIEPSSLVRYHLRGPSTTHDPRIFLPSLIRPPPILDCLT